MPNAPFDRAADQYDQTRALPSGIAEAVTRAVLPTLAGRRPVLEIGIGTGRIARPLLAAGVPLIGLDLARRMMDHLLAALPAGLPRPPLVEADAEVLPLASASVEAVLSVHVFHLLGDWLAALAEVRRVLRPGGVLLSGYEWRAPEAPGSRLMDQWKDMVHARGYGRGQAATRDFGGIKDDILASGGQFDEQVVGEWTVRRTLARMLETIEHRTWSSTWDVPDGFFAACLAELREWAIAEYGDLEREFEVPHRFVWQVCTWPD